MDPSVAKTESVSLIGMAGAGKSTLGRNLAKRLDWAFVDTDSLMEAYWGQDLQDLYDAVGRETFLELESFQVRNLGLNRAVIATGGSVVYSARAVERLKLLGHVVFLHIDLDTFLNRVGPAVGRAFARPPDKSLQDIFEERQPLYRAAADLTVSTQGRGVDACVDEITAWMERKA